MFVSGNISKHYLYPNPKPCVILFIDGEYEQIVLSLGVIGGSKGSKVAGFRVYLL